jgi:pimeloyl-ACP methyl ester carboxylesterase
MLWDGVVPLLADRFRIIRYDNRGAGGSSAPRPVSAYTMVRFADDFAAVVAACSPARPVHVLAHDWGSVGIWEYLGGPGATERVASFTSVSGPSQDHLLDYIFTGLRRPYRPRTFMRALSQALRLTYMAVFSIPVLAPLLVRRAVIKGIPAERVHHSDGLARDAATSLKTYPANYFRSFAGQRRDLYVDVPVQLIVNTEDPYVRPHGYDAPGGITQRQRLLLGKLTAGAALAPARTARTAGFESGRGPTRGVHRVVGHARDRHRHLRHRRATAGRAGHVDDLGLTGTPANGQKLAVRISDDGNGPWPITWGPVFINSGVMPENFDISVLEVTEPHVGLAR